MLDGPDTIWLIAAWSLVGLVAGGVANALAAALAIRAGVTQAGCPRCAAWPLPWPSIPILATLNPRHCPTCGAARPTWPLAGEIGLGVVYGVLAARHEWSLSMVLASTYAIVLAVALIADLRHHLIFNALTYPAIAGALVLAPIDPFPGPTDAALGGVAFGAALLFVYVAARLAYRRVVAFGLGDVKPGIFIGIVVGLARVPSAFLLTVGIGGVLAVGLALARRSTGGTMPYGPALVLAALWLLITEPR